jgi:hypothetical protein
VTAARQILRDRSSCPPITHDGQAHRLLQVRDGILRANAYLVELLIADQRIGDFSERTLNGLLVDDESLLVLRLSQPQIPAKGSPR